MANENIIAEVAKLNVRTDQLTDGLSTLSQQMVVTFQQVREENAKTAEDMHRTMKDQHIELHATIAKMNSDSQAATERLYRTTRPNMMLIISLIGLGLSVTIAIGGLVAYGFKAEIVNTQYRIETSSKANLYDIAENRMRIEKLIDRDLAELDARRAEERRTP